jgi:hypothetical protein
MANVRSVIFFGDAFSSFYSRQAQKVKDRINWVIGVIESLKVVPEKYLKHITGTLF